MTEQKITKVSGELDNNCKFTVCNSKKEEPWGIRVGSGWCLEECPNFISSTGQKVNCKGEKLVFDVHGKIIKKNI